jgi:F-box protein 18 (helicase)
LKKIKTAKTLYLTQSFRFNDNIARVANMILQSFKHEKNPIVGRPFIRSAKPAWNPKGYTIIARTNAGVFDQAARLFKNNRLGFIGGVQGYRLNIIRDVYRLYKGTREHIFDNYLKRFTTYTDLKSYAVAVEDIELLSVCKLVENYKASIPGLVDRINEKAVETSAAEIILTTAHKSKGLEWHNVLVMDDFPKLVENDAPIDPADLEPDEFNLIYVAITRTIHNLRFHQNSSISAFIKMIQREGRR